MRKDYSGWRASAVIGAVMSVMSVSAAFAAESDTVMYRTQGRQEIIDDVHVVRIGGDQDKDSTQNSMHDFLQMFYEDQYRHFYDPDAPTFLFMSRDGNLGFGVGGKVIVRGWFDWNGSQDTPGFFPYDIAIPRNPTERHDLGASLNSSALYMTLLGRRPKFNYMVYLQAAFSDKTFKLKKAYVRVNDFTIGLANTTFEDGDAIVPTVESQGPNGQAGKTQVLARWQHDFRKGWSLGAGVEFPSSDQDVVDGKTAACRDYVPDFAVMGQYAWDGGDSHVRLSALLRTMTYRNLLTQTDHNVTGWGVQLSGMANIIKPLVVYYSAMVGQGIGSYQGDLSEGAYDLVGVSNEEGKMVAPLAMGLTAGVQYWWSSKFYSCLALGETQYYQKHPLSTDQYRYGLYGAVNLFYKITPRFLSGIEYVTGKRKNHDGAHAGANRVTAVLTYSF